MNPRFFTLQSFCFVLILALAAPAFASGQEKVIYSFQGGADAALPFANLVVDAHGDLYGTTVSGGTGVCQDQDGGSSPCGAVYRLTPPSTAGGTWTESVIHSFQGYPNDGAEPQGQLLIDSQGNLYGTTYLGGSGVGSGSIICGSFQLIQGCGTIFELSPPAQEGGAWTNTVLYNFQAAGDGDVPVGRLAFDTAGNLYGVTLYDGIGGGYGGGLAFKLSPPTQIGGSWTETVLYDFGQSSTDAANPNNGLIFDDKGSLYGVSSAVGGASCNSGMCGTIFRLSPPATNGGTWRESVLYTFAGGSSGSSPFTALTFDGKGSLYGVNYTAYPYGNAFKLSPPSGIGGRWTLTTLYTFQGVGDGAYPVGGLTFDEKGNLYGDTFGGGDENTCVSGCGTVFRLSRSNSSTGWSKQILHLFHNDGSDGFSPQTGLVRFSHGKFYGTTYQGGTEGLGTVFSLSLSGK